MGEENLVEEDKKDSSPAKTTKSTDTFTSTSAAGVGDLQTRLDDLETLVEKHHEGQNNIIYGVLVASVLIVVAVAVEVVIFNGDFRSSLDSFKQQQTTENQTLQTNIQNEQGSINQELLNLKLNQSSN